MLLNIISLIILFSYGIFFLLDRRKAVLILFLIKLPLDQFAWRMNISFGFVEFKFSELFALFITLLLFALLVMDRIKDPNRSGFMDNIPARIRVPVIIFIVLCVMTILTAEAKFFTSRHIFKLLTGIVIGAFTVKTIKTEKDIDNLIRVMVISTGIISIIAIPTIFSGGQLQIFAPTSDNPYAGTYRAGGIGGYYSADGFAHAFLVYVPAILLLSNVYKQKWERFLCFFVMLFVLVAVFASALRIGWLSLLIMLAIWITVNKKWKLLSVFALLVLILFATNLLSETFQKAIQKSDVEIESFQRGELPPEYAFGGRPRIWRIFIEHYMQLPLLDKAFGNEDVLYISMATAGHDPHNDFLYIIIRMGFIGLGIILFLYIYTFIQIIKTMRRSDISYYDWQLGLTAILGLITMLLPSMTRTGLTNPNYEWFFWTFVMFTLNADKIS